MPGGPGQTVQFGKTKARFAMEAETGVVFDDVAGVNEAKQDLQEVVTFLKNQKNLPQLEQEFRKAFISWSTWYWKNPFSKSDCRRSWCSFLFIIWF